MRVHDEVAPAHVLSLPADERLSRIDEILELTYRSADLGNHHDPLDEAVYIIISAQATEAAYQDAFRRLRERWSTWDECEAAPADEIRKVLESTGLAMNKTRDLQRLFPAVRELCAKRGIDGLTLDWLDDLSDDEALAILDRLPGIGPKSARCILAYSFGRDVFAVDTHIRRILDRLGVVADRPGKKVRHADYEEVVPAEMRRRLHVNLLHHGRAVCRGPVPACERCPLVSFCPSGLRSLRPAVPVAVDAFGGAGGLGLGFRNAGFTIGAAIELDRAAAQSYRVNHPGTPVFEADVTQVTGEQLRATVPGLTDVAVVISGPPCQGYSVAGKRDSADAKNGLFRHVIRLAGELNSSQIVIENVKGMAGVAGVDFTRKVVAALRTAGYATAEPRWLKASEFGVPQRRRRFFFVARRPDDGDVPDLPDPTHCDGPADCNCGRDRTRTVLEALEDLPDLDAGVIAEHRVLEDGRVLLNGSTMRHSSRVVAKIARIPAGGGPISYRRLRPDFAATLVAGHRALPVHPVKHRTISTREAARLQGFPDTYVFAGRRGSHPLQVANAVPPPLAEAVARQLLPRPARRRARA